MAKLNFDVEFEFLENYTNDLCVTGLCYWNNRLYQIKTMAKVANRIFVGLSRVFEQGHVGDKIITVDISDPNFKKFNEVPLN